MGNQQGSAFRLETEKSLIGFHTPVTIEMSYHTPQGTFLAFPVVPLYGSAPNAATKTKA